MKLLIKPDRQKIKKIPHIVLEAIILQINENHCEGFPTFNFSRGSF